MLGVRKRREDVEKTGGRIPEFANVFADRDRKIEVFPFVFREEFFKKRAKEQCAGAVEELFRFELAEVEKGRIAARKDESA